MFTTLKNAWHIAELRKKICYTLLILILFRVGSAVPVPFLDSTALQAMVTGSGNLPANKAIMVKGGLGYVLIIGSSITFWDEKYIAWRPLQPEMRTSSVIAWKRHQPHTPAVEKFIVHLRDNLPQN